MTNGSKDHEEVEVRLEGAVESKPAAAVEHLKSAKPEPAMDCPGCGAKMEHLKHVGCHRCPHCGRTALAAMPEVRTG